MNKKEQDFRQRKTDAIKKMRSILDRAESEHRSMNATEQAEYNALDAGVEEFNKNIDAEMRVSALESETRGAPGFPMIRTKLPDGQADVDPEKEFRSIGEFFHALAAMKKDGRRDQRLDTLREQREQTMGTGATGGFALPTQFDSNVRQVRAQDGVVRSRAAIIEPGDPPDAKLEFPTLDQTSSKNMYGGIQIYHTGEGVTMTESTMNLREVTMEPKEVSGYCVITNKLLNNWSACSATIGSTFSQAVTGTEDYDFIRGDGINKSLGMINSAAAIQYPRAGAGAIAFADAYNMLSRVLMRGSLVWIASQTIIPQLASMVDAGGHAVWLGNGAFNGAAGSIPSTLLGVPLVFADRAPALGSKGDLSLINPSYYLIKDGSGPFAATADQLLFLQNKTVFKIVWNVDGKPWLSEPIALEGDTSKTISPFVVLN